MKKHHLIIILFVGIAAITCKKDKENWSQTLQGTAWSGEIVYTTGTTVTQPISIAFGLDSTLLLFQSFTEYPGVWHVNKEIITIKLSNNTITAKLGKERWSNITQTLTVGTITSFERSFIPTASLDGTVWIGKKTNTKDVIIRFKAGTKLEYSEVGSVNTPVTLTYFVRAGGILFNVPYPGTLYGATSYGAFYNNGTTFKGYAIDPYNTYNGEWTTKKQ